MSRIVLTGASGFLGHSILKYLKNQVAETLLVQHADPNLSETLIKVAQFKPDCFIHCAAPSSPKFCEENPEIARAGIVDYTKILCESAANNNAHFVFTSTDLIFDGARPLQGGFTELDEPAPRSVYARLKLEAENVVRTTSKNFCVGRLCLMYGPNANGEWTTLKWIIDALKNNQPLDMFEDEYRTIAYVQDSARALIEVATRRQGGILNFGGPNKISRYELGQLICNQLKLDVKLIRKAKQSDVASVPPRPGDVALDSSKLYEILGWKFKDVQSSISYLNL